ncbi:MAG TPA: hypothetical protein VKX49_03810 [Bryobacteraceae bacterium]|nr:hypothetical protein [Bryobacteraceae bacterium]
MKLPSIPAVALGLTVALLAGCKKNIDNNDAVKQGINAYLAKRSDLLSMDVSLTSVAYHGDEATATVRFQAKGNSSPSAGMSMQYVLERKGDQWVVKGRAGSDAHTGMPQGSPGAAAPGAAPQSNGGSLGAMPSLPNGHPAVGEPSGALPPGHPPIGEKKSTESK